MDNETKVKFVMFDGDVIALFPDEIYNDNLYGNKFIESYQYIGQHAAASRGLLRKKEATTNQFLPLYKELIKQGYNSFSVINKQLITYHRKPTNAEINFGHGSIHYRDFPLSECLNNKTGTIKKRLKANDDNLIYTR